MPPILSSLPSCSWRLRTGLPRSARWCLVMNDPDVGEQARAILATLQEAGIAVTDPGQLTLASRSGRCAADSQRTPFPGGGESGGCSKSAAVD